MDGTSYTANESILGVQQIKLKRILGVCILFANRTESHAISFYSFFIYILTCIATHVLYYNDVDNEQLRNNTYNIEYPTHFYPG